MDTDIPKEYREDFFRAVVDTVTDPVALVSKDFKILYHNKTISKIYGSIVGELCFETLKGRKQPCEDCIMLEVLKVGKPKKKIYKYKLPNGKVVWAEDNVAPFRNAEGKIIGVIDILRDVTEQKEARDLLQEALERLNTELSEAADYVKSLLPPPIVRGPVRTDWKFVPSVSLGGDSFGYHWLDEDTFVIYLVDVSGHGVGAALLSVSVMNALRSQSLPDTDFKNPEQVLASLNVAFPSEENNNMFFTIWYGVYNKSTRELIYASGGHPPALLFDRSHAGQSNATLLRTANKAIGVMPDVAYKKNKHLVAEQTTLYIFSDGAYEVQKSDGSMWQFKEFADFMNKIKSDSQSRLDRLYQHVKNIGSLDNFEDDFTIVEVAFA
ncbi:MAG: SpoIIE family protein phosphatase [Desulfobacterales bacterium]|nr:SpoIIE family protein phosphatase [Desulfobacterales bacterium]